MLKHIADLTRQNTSLENFDIYCTTGDRLSSEENWEEAGQAYLLAGTQQQLSGNSPTIYYIKASDCFKKSGNTLFSKYISKAIDKNLTENVIIENSTNPIELEKLATHYDSQFDQNNSVIAFLKASLLYAEEKELEKSLYCSLCAATILAENKHFQAAALSYESAIIICISSKKDPTKYFLKQIFCCLAHGDIDSCKSYVEDFSLDNPSFSDTPEYNFIGKIITSLSDKDENMFTSALSDYDQSDNLDPLDITIFLNIKRSFF